MLTNMEFDSKQLKTKSAVQSVAQCYRSTNTSQWIGTFFKNEVLLLP